VDGNNFSRIFSISSNKTIEIEGLTLTRGYGRGFSITFSGGGCIYNANANLSIRNSVVKNCFAIGSGNGGGIYKGGTLGIYNSTVINKSSVALSEGNGGGVYNNDGSVFTAENSDISGNTAGTQKGGSIYNRPNVMTNIMNSTLDNNTSEDGGAIFNDNGTIRKMKFLNL
jgi:large repetitive protein